MRQEKETVEKLSCSRKEERQNDKGKVKEQKPADVESCLSSRRGDDQRKRNEWKKERDTFRVLLFV